MSRYVVLVFEVDSPQGEDVIEDVVSHIEAPAGWTFDRQEEVIDLESFQRMMWGATWDTTSHANSSRASTPLSDYPFPIDRTHRILTALPDPDPSDCP